MLGKILLASKAIESDWNVVIGQKNYLRLKLKEFPPGIIIEKGMRKGMNKFAKDWKKKGHIVCMSDEEALTYKNNKVYFERNLDDNIDEFVDYFLSVGPRHYKTLLKKIDKKKILKIGNLKFDLYKKDRRKIFNKELKKIPYDKYILITSRFGNANSHEGKIETKINNSKYQASSKKLFLDFLNLPRILRKKIPKKTIVVRPHPSENFIVWNNFNKKIKNSYIIYNKDVATWILRASLLIQNRCTTGIEGYLLDKKVVSYKDQISKKDIISKIFYKISSNCNDEKEIKNISNNRESLKKTNLLNEILYSYKSNQKDAHVKLIENLNSIYKKNSKYLNLNKKIYSRISLKDNYVTLKNFLKNSDHYKYLSQKNGDTNLINYKNYFQEIKKVFKFKKSLRIKKLSKDIYLLN